MVKVDTPGAKFTVVGGDPLDEKVIVQETSAEITIS